MKVFKVIREIVVGVPLDLLAVAGACVCVVSIIIVCTAVLLALPFLDETKYKRIGEIFE